MVWRIFFSCFFCPGFRQLGAGFGLNLRSVGGNASILGGWLSRGQGSPSYLLHFSDGLGGVILAGSVNFYLSADGIHFAVGPTLVFIIGTANDDTGPGCHVRTFMRFDFLISLFKLFDLSLLLRGKIFSTGDGGLGRQAHGLFPALF